MGQSKSIEELAASDQKFQDFLDEKRKTLEEKTAATRKQMDADIEKFYADGKWDDRKPVASAAYYDVQIVSEFSLDNISKIMQAISGAIFGSNNVPAGTKIENNAGNNPTVKMIPNLQLLILSKAFSAIQGILEAFTLKSSVSITQQHKIEVVAPGMTIFVYVNSNSFQSQSFFTKDIITQYFYVIDSFISKKQLGDYSEFEDLRLFEEEKAALRNIANNLVQTMGSLTDLNKLDVIMKLLDGIYDRMESVTERITDLTNAETLARKEKVQHIRTKLLK